MRRIDSQNRSADWAGTRQARELPGEVAIIPWISEEPGFLGRIEARWLLNNGDTLVVCVPIKLRREVTGAPSANRPFSGEKVLRNGAWIPAIMASMLVQAVRLRQVAEKERERLLDENARLQAELKDRFRSKNIVGHATVMRHVYDLIGQMAESNATALLLGESGTGIKLVAQAIHYGNLRAE